MSSYINADALKENCYKQMDELMESTSEHLSAEALSLLCGFTLIDSAPSIDIVFCKECKHRPIKEDADGVDWGFNIIAPEGSSRCPCLVDDGWYSWMPKDNFFCGYGEREDE